MIARNSTVAFAVAVLLAGVVSPASSQQQPLTTFRHIQGTWTSIEPGMNVAFQIDRHGRVSALAGPLAGRLIVQTGPGGSNFAISSTAGTCYYDVRFYDRNDKAHWVLTASNSRNGDELICPDGNFAHETGVDDDNPNELQDAEIKRRQIRWDYTDVSSVYRYEIFIYENPVYAYVDTNEGRKTILYSACSSTHKACDALRAQERFCALQGLQSDVGLTVDATHVVNAEDFERNWYWDLFSGRTVRQSKNARNLQFLSRVSCRKR